MHSHAVAGGRAWHVPGTVPRAEIFGPSLTDIQRAADSLLAHSVPAQCDYFFITRFYEKVLKVKADVAAIHLKFCFDPVAAI
jgi:hypothetical protein